MQEEAAELSEGDRVVLGRAAGRLMDLLTGAAASMDAGLTPTQLRLVDALAEGPATVGAVAAAISSTASTTSRAADRLAGAGLMVRAPSPDSRREVVLELTRAGRAVAQEWTRRRGDAVAAVVEALPPGGRAGLLAVLRPMVAAEPPLLAPAPAPPSPSAVRSYVVTALLAADPDAAAGTLVQAAVSLLGAEAAQLALVSSAGDRFVPLAPALREATSDATSDGLLLHAEEEVESGARGEVLRSGRPLVEHGETRWAFHLPLLGRRDPTGVLTLVLATAHPNGAAAAGPRKDGHAPARPTPQPPAQDEPGRAWREAAVSFAETAALVLPTATTGSSALRVARRAHEWTVGAEVQERQISSPRVTGAGVEAAAQVQPAWHACSDAYDLELHDATLDVVLMDARVPRRYGPLVVAVALAAFRHARQLGLDLAAQAQLADQAVFATFAGTELQGELSVDVLAVRVHTATCQAEALATSGMDLLRQRGPARGPAVEDVRPPTHEPIGVFGDSRYEQSRVHLGPGDRLVLLSDGLGSAADEHTPGRARRLLQRLGSERPDEVVRRLVVDRVRLHGPDGLDDDATAICIDVGV